MQSVGKFLKTPIPEIKKSDVDPLKYRKFIRQFYAKVVANSTDNNERMNYLVQMTYGEAYRVVSGFSHVIGEKA